MELKGSPKGGDGRAEKGKGKHRKRRGAVGTDERRKLKRKKKVFVDS